MTLTHAGTVTSEMVMAVCQGVLSAWFKTGQALGEKHLHHLTPKTCSGWCQWAAQFMHGANSLVIERVCFIQETASLCHNRVRTLLLLDRLDYDQAIRWFHLRSSTREFLEHEDMPACGVWSSNFKVYAWWSSFCMLSYLHHSSCCGNLCKVPCIVSVHAVADFDQQSASFGFQTSIFMVNV